MRKISTYFFNSKTYNHLSDRIKKIKISSSSVSLFRVLQIFINQMRKDNIPERASSMAFNFVLSLFPAIIFIFTLIPYIPIPDLQEKIMVSLKNLLPVSIYNGAASAIYDIIHIPHGGLLSFGFFFSLFTATNGIMSMISAFNKCYKTAEKRGYFRRIFVALTIVILLVFIAFISIAFAILTRQYLHLLSLDRELLYYFAIVFKYLLFIIVFFFAISVIYYMAPSVSVRWKFFSLGSLIASLLSILFTLGFAAYVNIFDSYNKLYGSIGAFIGVMLWFYAISIVLLVGFEVNASLELAKRERLKKRTKERALGIRGS